MKQVKNGLKPIVGFKKVKELLARPLYPTHQDMHNQSEKTNTITYLSVPEDRKWLIHNDSNARYQKDFNNHVPGETRGCFDLDDKHDEAYNRKRNKIFDILTAGILLITVEIQTEYPELYKVLSETPVLYNFNKADISMAELENYLEIISYQLDDFRKSEANHKV